MTDQIQEKFEDRYGSDFEEGKGANTQKIEDRKYGFKSTDSFADKIKKMKAKGALEEAEKATQEPEVPEDDDDDEPKDKELFDAKEEKRIAMMQYMNPRILKTKEKKDYMSRANIQEHIWARLNELATNKLNLLKTAIAQNIPTELDEAREPKVVQVPTAGGGQGWKASNPYRKKVQYFGLEFKDAAVAFANKGAPQSAAEIVADHQALHAPNDAETNYRRPSMREIDDALDAERKGNPEPANKLRDIMRARKSAQAQSSKKWAATRPAQKFPVYEPGRRYVGDSVELDGPVIDEAAKINKEKLIKLLYRDRSNVRELGKGAGLTKAQKAAARKAIANEEVEQINEAKRNPNVMQQGRTKIVKARVRGGKVQRRKKLSAVKGYTIRGGKLKRMSAQERMRRKRAAKRAKVKRKAKMARALMKRKRSMRRRASLGLKE